jgi:hypothetical protein
MRRFLMIVLILSLVVALAGSLTAVALLFQAGEQAQTDLAARETHVVELEGHVGLLEAELGGAAATREALGRAIDERDERIATLEAEVVAPIPTAETLAPTPPPTLLSLSAPADGEEFREGEEVTVRWQTSAVAGVAYVTLQVDGEPISVYEVEGDQTGPIEGEFVWTATGEGSHRLLVIPVSASGGMAGEPASLSIYVIPGSDAQGLDPATRAVMDMVEINVAELRGLAPQTPVTRTLYTRQELEAYLIRDLEEEMSPEEARHTVIEMAAFELLPLGTDLWELLVGLYTEQVAGFYDSETDSFVVVEDDGTFGALDKTVYAHEFVHALQDQYYDLDALDPGDANDDAALAVTALIEGDASLTMQLYTLEYLDSNELYEALSESMEVETEQLDNAPPAIVTQMTFPYEAGLAFVQLLYQEGGFEAVDRAFSDPPQSTEQILHPERYLAGERPQVVSLPPLTDTLGAGWEYIDGNVLGELGLKLYLAGYLDDQLSAAAADGWGGDRYAVHTEAETGEIVLVLQVVWDREAEATEFLSAFRSFGKAHPDSSPVSDDCWQGEDALCVYQVGDETLIIRAPDVEIVDRLKELFPGF